VQSGGLAGSRLGFRSVEDLGSGLRALFTLESVFTVDDGNAGQCGSFYGRQAFVGLQDGWGTVSLGRQLSSLYRATDGSACSATDRPDRAPPSSVASVTATSPCAVPPPRRHRPPRGLPAAVVRRA